MLMTVTRVNQYGATQQILMALPENDHAGTMKQSCHSSE